MLYEVITAKAIAKELNVKGLMNIQFGIMNDTVYIIEVNPRASRTIPFVSKAIGVPLAKLATKVMLGKTFRITSYNVCYTKLLRGKFLSGSKLGFGHSCAKIFVNTHDFACGFHFRPKNRIHLGKAVKGHHCLLDTIIGP